MINKDNTILEEKNKGITPDATIEALVNLPYNYVKLASALLDKWKAEGKIDQTYSNVYISRVKTGDKGAFNEDIMNALVEVGQKNLASKKSFGRITKKASPSN
jgi:predicted transposase YbfD/YdcC